MSTAFRITQRSVNLGVGQNLQDSLQKLQLLQDQLSSGKAVSKPSDSPTDAIAALRFRADIRRATQLQRNADDATGWLGTADTTLTSGLDLINRARALVSSGVNGSMSQADREAIAVEIDQLRGQALSLANTQYLGRAIFAGTAPTTQAYDQSGTFLGDNASIDRTVAPNVSVSVNLTGPAVFGAAGADLFATLSQVASDLRTNPAGLTADAAALDGHFTSVNQALASVGARYNHVETMKDKVATMMDNTKSSLSQVEDIDLPATTVQLQMQTVAYQAALAATAKVIQPSLVDFLR